MTETDPPTTKPRGVADDVEAIFAPLRSMPTAAAHEAPPAAPIQTIGREARPGLLTPRLGTALAALVVALTAGVIGAKPLLEEQSRAAAAGALLASMPATSAPTAGPVVPDRALVVEPAQTMTPPVQIVAPEPPRIRPARSPTVSKASASKAAGCRSLSGNRRRACFHQEVMRADRRLRRAYASAGDAGVARPVMVSYRNRWAGLRRQAIQNPSRVVDGYSAMARGLTREARAARRQVG